MGSTVLLLNPPKWIICRAKADNFLELVDNKANFLELVDNFLELVDNKEGEGNFLELVDNKEGEEEDADNNAGASGLLSIIRLGGRLILNTFRVGGTNSLKACLDSWTLAGVEVFDGGVDVRHDPTDLLVLQRVHLLLRVAVIFPQLVAAGLNCISKVVTGLPSPEVFLSVPLAFFLHCINIRLVSILGALVEVPLDLVAFSVSGREGDQGQQGQQE